MVAFSPETQFLERLTRYFIPLLAVYFLLLLLIQELLFPGSSEDTAEQIYLAQAWSWVYKHNQPPLFTWLVRLSQSVFGVSAAAVIAVKLLAIFATYLFIQRAALRLLDDPRLATAAALSLAAMYYFGWNAVLNMSNTVLVGTLCAATLYALLRMEEHHGPGAYVILGLAVGLGLLSKYNYSFFLVPLVIAGLFDPVLRSRLLSPRIGVTLAIAILIAAPHFLQVLSPDSRLVAEVGKASPESTAGAYLPAVLESLGSGVQGALSFVLPGFVFLLLMFPRAFLPGPKADRKTRFLKVFLAALAGIVILGVLIHPRMHIETHWWMVLIPYPILVLARAEARGMALRRIAIYTGLCVLMAVAVPIGIVGKAMIWPGKCKNCDFFIPYEQLAGQIRAAGFAEGTLVVYDSPVQIGGNLLRYFPDSRVVNRRFLPFMPPPGTGPGQCLLAWHERRSTEPGVHPRLVGLAKRHLEAEIPPDIPIREAEAPIPRSGGRTVKLLFALVKEGAGKCR